MKRIIGAILTIGMMTAVALGQSAISVIPMPVQLEQKQGVFEINPQTVIIAPEKTSFSAVQLNQMFMPAMNFPLTIKASSSQTKNSIQFQLISTSKSLGDEGYQLSVTPEHILIKAEAEAGLYYGMQTLRQLLPVEIFNPKAVKNVRWQVPCVEITDQPRFAWRGMHLDVGRYFMPKEFVKKYIDTLAMHKLNTFHWHLTEDQGWRIEIKKYPKLTEIGSMRKETVIGRNTGKYDGIPHGGFYTQDDVREIVAYAKERHITVVPEIEMPGHSQAALAAYPELSCTGGPFEVRTRWGVVDNVYCAGNDAVLEFNKNVLKEVLDLFPSTFIHIGGDECPKKQWEKCPKCQARIKAEGLKDEHELQSWFITQIDTFLTEQGRRLLGWDEILEGGLAPGATVMSWRGESGGIKAVQSGHDVVMAPNTYTYFDYYQADPKEEPLAIGGFLPLEKVYHYNPVPEVLTAAQQNHVLGVQAQIWTEYIATPEHAEYMAFPRGCALSEIAWTPDEKKDYDQFYQRLTIHAQRLAKMGVNFRRLDPVRTLAGTWSSGQTKEVFQPKLWDISSVMDGEGTYAITFQYTQGAHRLDIQSVELLANNHVVAKDYHEGITGGMTKNNTYSLELKSFDSSARYQLKAVVRSDGGTDSNGRIYLVKKK